MNNKYLLILISAVLFPLAGCACKTRFPAPEPLCSSGLTLDEAMRAGEDVLGRLRFPISKYDKTAAVIRTGPYEGAHFFEFWRMDDASTCDRAYSNVHSIRRFVELRFEQKNGRLCIHCRVDMQRLSLPEKEVSGSAKAFALFSQSEETKQTLKVNPEQVEEMAWIDMEPDNRLAAKILKKIEKEIDNPKK
ncbi:MAG: hypothetical protein GWO86_01785 [Planctomycetes bacterium]|nr:hypothetical protein [Planctomycetota bacterium]